MGARSSSLSGFRLRERGLGACSRSLGSFRLCMAGPGFGDRLDHRRGTSEFGYGLKPPNKTAPAGLTKSRHPTGCVTASVGQATARGILKPLVIQFFCITPIQAALNDFWGLSRHLSRLDKPQKSLNTIRDRGDAEAPSAGISQPVWRQNHPSQPKYPDGAGGDNRQHPSRLNNISRRPATDRPQAGSAFGQPPHSSMSAG